MTGKPCNGRTKIRFKNRKFAAVCSCGHVGPGLHHHGGEVSLDPKTAEMARKQFQLAKGPQMLPCECGRDLPIRFMFRCFYCRLWFCEACAEIHFGKSREEYFAKRAAGPAQKEAK